MLAALPGALLAGCRSDPSGVVPPTRPLSLQRDHYVLPDEPPPPVPRPEAEQRRLEAEWPPVSPFSVRTHRYSEPRRVEPVATCPAGAVRVAAPTSSGGPTGRPPVILMRTRPAPHGALPELVRERP